MKKLLPVFLLLLYLLVAGCENKTVTTNENSNDFLIGQLKILKEQYDSEIEFIQTKLFQKEKEISDLKDELANYKNQNIEFVYKMGEIECQIDSPYPYISDTKANCLINKASTIMRDLNNGGENSELTGDYSKININDPRINSEEKIINLLNQIFTPNISQEIYEMFGFEMIDGEMYKSSSDLPFTGWGEQFIIVNRLLKEEKGIITYKKTDTWELNVEFIFLEKQGWRINTKTW